MVQGQKLIFRWNIKKVIKFLPFLDIIWASSNLTRIEGHFKVVLACEDKKVEINNLAFFLLDNSNGW